ncbi:hypothetical protein IWZ00DRAFT_485746 [Phyllosticta capitalensis]|uniref:uncharacterized protein n=1 Tax=Phyllosticta capitalensis TaxID=121624 RepID=UPI00312CF12B
MATASPQSPTKLSTVPVPAPATSSSSSSSPSNPSDHIHTYHCLCTQLLLASTTPLPSLPRRGGDADDNATDRAYILPLPAPPSSSSSTSTDTATATTTDAEQTGDEAKSPHYALTLSLSSDRTPLIIQRDDGLEKRYLARCGRCRVVVGYWLDWSQFASSVSGAAGKTSGRREDVVYLLPGGLLNTQDMAAGKKSGEGKGV